MYRSKNFKVLCLVVLTVFVLGMLMTGCGQEKSGESENTTVVTENTTKVAESTAQELPPVELKWYIAGKAEADIESVSEAMSKILKEKINATIELIDNPWGDHTQKMPIKIASGEAFDLCYTSNWCFDYASNASKGSFVEMDGLIEKYAPNAYKAIPEKMWDTVKIKDKIYGFINYQVEARQSCFTIQKKFLDKYGISADSIKSIADLEPLLLKIKENDKDVVPLFGTGVQLPFAEIRDFEEFAGDYIPGAVMKGDASAKAVNPWEASPALKEQLKIARDWYTKGIFKSDIAVLKDMLSQAQSGKIAVFVATWKPGVEVENAAAWGLKPEDLVDIKYGNPYLSATACQPTLTAISSTSKNPERAMMLLELINTDKELYNTMCFGIENKHYKKVSDNLVEAIANSGYEPNRDWEFGNQFNAYYRVGQKQGIWEETIKLNEDSEASPLLGFSFDQSPVKTEIAQCTAIVTEYKPLLLTGTVDPEKKLPEMLEKLKNAGSERIVAELQKQIDVFKSSK